MNFSVVTGFCSFLVVWSKKKTEAILAKFKTRAYTDTGIQTNENKENRIRKENCFYSNHC